MPRAQKTSTNSRYYFDKIIMRGGNVTLYKRVNVESPIWQMRIKVPGEEEIRKSAKTKDLEDAKMFANNEYDILLAKKTQNIPIRDISFEGVYKKWWEAEGRHKGKDRQRYYTKTFDRYFNPFFGNILMNNFTAQKVTEYWAWRLDYWIDGPGSKEKVRYRVEQPAPATLNQERIALNEVLQFGLNQNYYTRVIRVELPKAIALEKKKQKRTKSRTAFKDAELIDLIPFMDKWAETSVQDKREKFTREAMRDYVLFMLYGGFRPHEVHRLVWKDIDLFYSKDGKKAYVEIHVPEGTKHGERWVHPQPEIKEVIERMLKRVPGHKPDDFIFTTHQGKQLKSRDKPFQRMLEAAGLLYDEEGRKRTPYVMRHTYITQRLRYGDVSMQKVADNAGTSIKMIEEHYYHIIEEERRLEVEQLTRDRRKQ